MIRYKELISHLSSYSKVIVAFSGGIDSYFVLKAAVDSIGKENVLAITGDSPSLKRSEKELTTKLAAEVSARHRFIFTDELNDPNYFNNPNNRCFFCKNELYNKLEQMRKDIGYDYVLDGTNCDDMGDYRPGFKASRNYGVMSPLADLKFTKKEIREISHSLGLEIWDKPASPCLSSRIPYGQQVTIEKLSMIEKAESVLKELGFKEYRARHFEFGTNGSITKLAKIEISVSEMERVFDSEIFSIIDLKLKKLGYSFVTLDMGGLKSGSLNVKMKLRLPEQNNE